MGKGTLTIYSASAGSGKTYKLTEIYLKRLFSSPYGYRKILAVTFTNKATAEMKSRILDNLYHMASGKGSDYLRSIRDHTGKSEETIRNEAGEILFTILHDFSRISVTTIDSFFQKVIRAFAREAGLHSGYSIEIDHSRILSDAVDETIASASDDKKLRDWLSAFLMSNLDEERSWNMKNGILKLAEELFNEKFKILSAPEKARLEDKDFLLAYIGRVRKIRISFEKYLTDAGRKCENIFSEFSLSDEMFYQKSKGIPGFIRNMASGIFKINSYVLEITKDPPRWCSGKMPGELQAALDAGLDKIIRDAVVYYDSNIISYNTAVAVLSDIYALGILSDILRKVRSITTESNSFLLSDAGEFLKLITEQDQAPFIYEKTGNRYENFMIDEFQDTSVLQWNNFKPLIDNSMAEGADNLLVGDIKQSIYRWRNSDWKILDKINTSLIDNERFLGVPLRTNWRSCKNIIEFNNALFSVIPAIMDEECGEIPGGYSFKRLFSEAVQEDPGKKDGGFVRLEFIGDDCSEGKNITGKWTDKVLQKLPGLIEQVQDLGYKASDIGILVRDGSEGGSVLRSMINYRSTCTPEKAGRYNYNIISSDSLLLCSSAAVNFIISVISSIVEPENVIHKAKMLRYWLLSMESDDASGASLMKDELESGDHRLFPGGYSAFIDSLKDRPLFEATESIISFFGLGNHSWNVPYLNAFQDCVLNFTGNNHGFRSFLDWWDTSGRKKSVVLPENQDAAKVLTLHKSKGLEFGIVILPFLSWCIDHRNVHQPFMWLKPSESPFDDLGIVPVRYRSGLENTIFRHDYLNEKFSVYVDNINLLYVAMTRAKNAIFGFIPDNSSREKRISEVLKNAITDQRYGLFKSFDKEKKVLETGEIISRSVSMPENKSITSSVYPVNRELQSLKLRLHGESYFSKETSRRINYGKLMHEVFENIKTRADIPGAVRKLVLDGKIPDEESTGLEEKVRSLVGKSPASGWFETGNDVLNEAGILLPGGSTRRPDRIIFRDGRVIIVDFKFGEENVHYKSQMTGYRKLLNEMGYADVDAFLWYVDKDEIIAV